MTPDPNTDPVATGAVVPTVSASFRHGRILVWIVAGVTVVIFTQDAVRQVWLDQWHGHFPKILGDCLMTGIICWCAARGGAFSTGCLGVLYGLATLLFCVAFGFASVGLVGEPSQTNWKFGLQGEGLGNVLDFVGLGLWPAFSFWVLFFSKDARLYRTVRRHGLAEAEASAFEWPSRRG